MRSNCNPTHTRVSITSHADGTPPATNAAFNFAVNDHHRSDSPGEKKKNLSQATKLTRRDSRDAEAAAEDEQEKSLHDISNARTTCGPIYLLGPCYAARHPRLFTRAVWTGRKGERWGRGGKTRRLLSTPGSTSRLTQLPRLSAELQPASSSSSSWTAPFHMRPRCAPVRSLLQLSSLRLHLQTETRWLCV